jgi:hypothetical protein
MPQLIDNKDSRPFLIANGLRFCKSNSALIFPRGTARNRAKHLLNGPLFRPSSDSIHGLAFAAIMTCNHFTQQSASISSHAEGS